jgi:hypothetical protein
MPIRDCRVDDRKRGAHRAFGRVLMRLRITEIGKDTVAHEFGDITVETGNSAGAGILIALDQAAQILGIEHGGKCRRADEVAEQHRDLPTLSFGCLRCRSRIHRLLFRLARRDLGIAVQGRDGLEKLPPLTERNPELLKVLLGQIRKDVEIDVVGG